jgi:hypothetical protein
VLGLEWIERPYSILTGAVDAGSLFGSRAVSGEDSKTDVVRRGSGSFIAKGFTKIVSLSCDSSITSVIPGVVPGGIPGTIISSSILSFTGLDTVRLNTSW